MLLSSLTRGFKFPTQSYKFSQNFHHFSQLFSYPHIVRSTGKRQRINNRGLSVAKPPDRMPLPQNRPKDGSRSESNNRRFLNCRRGNPTSLTQLWIVNCELWIKSHRASLWGEGLPVLTIPPHSPNYELWIVNYELSPPSLPPLFALSLFFRSFAKHLGDPL